jgi:hypothetical protein
VPLEKYHLATSKDEHIHHRNVKDESVVVLEEIIDDLKYIGDSEMVLDEEESALVYKIVGNVASSIHFYMSAMAYDQRRYMIQHHDSFDSTKIINLALPFLFPTLIYACI